MKSSYRFKLIEKDRYQNWLNKNYFKTENNLDKKTFTILIPPPNITGYLHLGHAWNNVLQDIVIRNKKMLGYDVLFIPGMDHAGIATQAKIKQKLKEKGFLDQTLTKETFLKYAYLWKNEYSNSIRKQWSQIGLFLDYEYEKFTLDTFSQEIVGKVFIKLYKDNLIYRDYKIINWDSVLQTTISNIEVNYKKRKDKLFYLKYFLVDDEKNFLEVATTRPETLFGDQALAVNPQDKRYKHLIEKKVIVPSTNSVIDVISDKTVDMEFGTGVVKVTPAHDENDFQIGKKNNLKVVLCINKDGTMKEIAQKYKNLSISECRQKLIDDLTQVGLVSKIEDYEHMVGFSTISDSIIEHRVSLQWFLKSKELAHLVLKQNEAHFFPNRFHKNFNSWLETIDDWCISRQLWWGHPIPIWYKGDQIKAQIDDPGDGFKRDDDVLDTWFSSSLWPLITLDFENQQKDSLFKRRFPFDLLVTGYDILSFWVTKMFLQSIHFTKKIPFKNILLHGLVRDHEGQKMSKSKGNGILPETIIEEYGIDALRWYLTTSVSNGTDLFFDKQKLINSSNFINKIWNISRFIQMNLYTKETDFEENLLLFPEKALLFQLSELNSQIDRLYKGYEFNLIGELLYHFVWEEFGNWYLEFLKMFFKKPQVNLNTQKFLLFVFKNILKFLHPFIPFLTDAIYEQLTFNESILHSPWPRINYFDKKDFDKFQILKKIIVKIRNWKITHQIDKKRLPKIYIKTSVISVPELEVFLTTLKNFFQTEQIEIISKNIVDENYFYLYSEKNVLVFVDKDFLTTNNKTEIQKNFFKQKELLLEEIKRSEKILKNKSFLEKASKWKIQEEKNKYAEYLKKYENLIKNNNII
ncbi:valine--tRNA ligase ['Camptotheca acuminata' phytoplasma]|uniref:valine--tRNA ligase n=1 Tax='Camptotheca acuminata' phytoplasma TaxID=3239192 RepID=UPI00351A8332